jgi:MoxR-like ATPase
MMMRAARVNAWLEGRGHMIPEDLQNVFKETIAHRIFFAPVYELRREWIIDELMDRLLRRVAAP